MSEPGETNWQLFLDESGRLDRRHDDALVGGLLLAEQAGAARDARLRAALEAAGKGLPMPLHFWLIDFPVIWPLLEVAESRRDGSRRRPLADAEGAWEALREDQPERVRRVLGLLKREEEPDGTDLKRLDRRFAALRPRLWRAYAARSREVQVQVGVQLVSLDEDTAKFTERPVGVQVVLAGEGRRGETVPGWEEHEPPRYLALLRPLLSRVQGLLEECGGEHRVTVHALTTHLPVPELGSKAVVPLGGRHLMETIRALEEEFPDSPVRFVAGTTPRFRRGVSPAFILADFVANRSRAYLRQRLGLAALESELSGALRLPVRRDPPGRTPITAGGVAFRRLAALRRGEKPEDWPPDVRPWAIEQADEWAGGRAK